jgi:hypothetical protein
MILIIFGDQDFVGLSFLVPGVVSPDLPAAWARPAAHGDVRCDLALLPVVAVKSRLGTILVWVFNVWDCADLLFAFDLQRSRGSPHPRATSQWRSRAASSSGAPP